MTKVIIRKSKLFDETFAKHKGRIDAKFKEFIRTKMDDPMARFGSKDAHFTGDGPLGQTDIIHAHLTHDISLLYKRSGKNPTYIDLLAVVSHDELGTGQPANIKKQKTMAKRLATITIEGVAVPTGKYAAVASGHQSIVMLEGRKFIFYHDNAVKGVNIPDMVTVTESGSKSMLLGKSVKRLAQESMELSELPNGTYPAIVSGYVSVARIDNRDVEFRFNSGVRGNGIRDTITISDGTVRSQVLGDL